MKSMTTLMEHVGVRHIDLLKLILKGRVTFFSVRYSLQLVDQFS